jgi:hypothetical protein
MAKFSPARVGMVFYCFLCGHGLAAVIPGHVEGWGSDSFGQSTPPIGLDGVIAVAAGGLHSLALKEDGTVVAWGANFSGQTSVPPELRNVIAISAGYTHSAALRSDGSVIVWGADGNSIITTPPSDLLPVTAISAAWSGNGDNFTLALQNNGTVRGWGVAGRGQLNIPPTLTNVVSIAAGPYHCLAAKSDGTVISWANDESGGGNVPAGLNNVVAVRAAQGASAAIRGNGSYVIWGIASVTNGVPSFDDLRDLQLGVDHGIILRANGTVAVWGSLTAPPGITGVTAIAAGLNNDLYVTARPKLIGITAPIVAQIGATVSISINATGGPLTYQWQHKGTNLPGEVSATLAIINLKAEHAGTYTANAINAFGSVTGSTKISYPPPQITVQPENLTRYRGETVILSVAAIGVDPLTYHWLKNRALVAGANGATLSFPNISTADAGAYTVIITDAVGTSVSTSERTLSVIDPRAVSLSLRPVSDTTISPAANPQADRTILTGTRRNGLRDRGLLRFDLASIPASAEFKSIRMSMVVVRQPGRNVADGNFNLYRMLKNWGADASWTHASAGTLWTEVGSAAGTDYATQASATRFVARPATYEWAGPQLNADIEFWRSNPNANFGWLLLSDIENTPGSARHFGSNESGNSPRLLIDYVIPPPLPQLTALHQTNQILTFQLAAGAGYIYRLESRAEIDRGDWISLTNVPAGNGQQPLTFNIPIADGQKFFRILAD